MPSETTHLNHQRTTATATSIALDRLHTFLTKCQYTSGLSHAQPWLTLVLSPALLGAPGHNNIGYGGSGIIQDCAHYVQSPQITAPRCFRYIRMCTPVPSEALLQGRNDGVIVG